MPRTFRRILSNARAQGLAEYGLILGLVGILCIAAVLFMSGGIQNVLSNIGSSL